MGNATKKSTRAGSAKRKKTRKPRLHRLNPFKNPFPQKTPNGKIVANEICRCGHFRTQHIPTLQYGHGACTMCQECGRFTWKGMIYGGISKEVDRLLAEFLPQISLEEQNVELLTERLENASTFLDQAQEREQEAWNAESKAHKKALSLEGRNDSLRRIVQQLQKELQAKRRPLIKMRIGGRVILADPALMEVGLGKKDIMGAMKKILHPYYEELLDEFWSKKGRDPNTEETTKMWEKAEENYKEAVDAQLKWEKEHPDEK